MSINDFSQQAKRSDVTAGANSNATFVIKWSHFDVQTLFWQFDGEPKSLKPRPRSLLLSQVRSDVCDVGDTRGFDSCGGPWTLHALHVVLLGA